jgi:periplasmic divalent cation tolerance protein
VPTSSVSIVLTTIGADADAAALAKTLVEERLAACVNIVPGVRSIYRWQGAVSQDLEQQLIIKTATASLNALEARLRQLHPYELPEFIVVHVSGGSDAYLNWVTESVG